jgi:hypothetical protein
LLNPEALKWLNAYHAALRQQLEPLLHPEEDAGTLSWLANATAPI